MTKGDLYYIDRKGNQQIATRDISLVEAKRQVKSTRSICSHVNFMSGGEHNHIVEGAWMLLIHGKGWRQL